MVTKSKRLQAHEDLDTWIEGRMKPSLPPYMSRDIRVIDLGKLFYSMQAAADEYLKQQKKKIPETITIEGKKYLLEDIRRIKPIK